MRILLTGGSGDLGSLLSKELINQGDTPINIDVASPKSSDGAFVKGSILDRDLLLDAAKGVDCIVHIAAWHGVHELPEHGGKDAYDFHDLNVTGTLNTLEAAAQNSVKKFVFISSTSTDDKYGLYGHTKILNEEMMRAYADRHDMDILILRPRAFIPSWNKSIYNDFIEWANWFSKGAVHIDDMTQATLKAVNYLKDNKAPFPPPTMPIDGAYDYTENELNNWDKDGAGSTFKDHYGQNAYDITVSHGIDPARKPKVVGSKEAEELLGYDPQYSLKSLLDELKIHGKKGPPSPF